MTNRSWESMDEIRDVKSFGQYESALKEGASEETAFKAVKYRTRDNARTPMQWDDSVNGGFSSHEPWTPVNSNFRACKC